MVALRTECQPDSPMNVVNVVTRASHRSGHFSGDGSDECDPTQPDPRDLKSS